MKKLLLTSIAALLLATGTAHATDYPPSLKAGAWVSMCTSKEAAAKVGCAAYAVGLYDGLILWHANSKDPIKICVPEEKPLLTRDQLVNIGLEYVKKHPDSNPRPIAVVLREALEEAFPLPCREM